MNKKQELIDYVIGNEFITKPSLQDKFTKLLDEALAEQLILHGVVNNDSGVCPNKKGCKTIMFTSDLDICQKCNKTFEGK